jgi:hypothetical protein
LNRLKEQGKRREEENNELKERGDIKKKEEAETEEEEEEEEERRGRIRNILSAPFKTKTKKFSFFLFVADLFSFLLFAFRSFFTIIVCHTNII